MGIGAGSHTPESAMSLAEKLVMLRKRVKDQDKENSSIERRKRVSGGSQCFFVASRRKSLRPKE